MPPQDIGSGNTKGGFFDKGLVDFNNFSFNYGTQALANEVNESLTQPTLNTYLTALINGENGS